MVADGPAVRATPQRDTGEAERSTSRATSLGAPRDGTESLTAQIGRAGPLGREVEARSCVEMVYGGQWIRTSWRQRHSDASRWVTCVHRSCPSSCSVSSSNRSRIDWRSGRWTAPVLDLPPGEQFPLHDLAGVNWLLKKRIAGSQSSPICTVRRPASASTCRSRSRSSTGGAQAELRRDHLVTHQNAVNSEIDQRTEVI